MFAAAFDAGGEPKKLVFVESNCGVNRVQAWFAFRERTGLVDDERIDTAMSFDCLGGAEHHALHTPQRHAREESVVGIELLVARRDPRGLAVRARCHHQAMHVLDTPAPAHTLGGEPVEELGM